MIRGGGVGQGGELLNVGDLGFVDGGIEQPGAVEGAELIVGHAVGIAKVAVQLAGIDTQNIIGRRRVTEQTIAGAGIIPIVGVDAARGLNGDGFG